MTRSNNENSIPEEVRSAIRGMGYELDQDQLHIGGERSVMSAHKLVLTGTDGRNGSKVVIKASLDEDGARDIRNEHKVRELLSTVQFAERDLIFPREHAYFDGNITISVTEFIDQEKVFVEHSLREQFFMALSWFEAQETFHATTYEHVKSLAGTLANWTSSTYLGEVREIVNAIHNASNSDRALLALSRLEARIHDNTHLIDRFSGFLNHTDLVPHNLRISKRTLYVLDQVSIWFGNKYEGWARFINYMTIHNPPLARLMVSYITEHRGEDEALLLSIMRCYKAAILMRYYAKATTATEGDLNKLSQLRFEFWLTALEHLLEDEELSLEYIERYKEERNKLRSEEEKRRQREFATV